MRSSVLLLLCCIAIGPALLAQEADLAVVSVQLDKNSVVTGERFTITSQVRNNGPDAARDVLVSFGSNLGLFPISVTAPAGWTCERQQSVPTGLSCTTATFASAAVANFTTVMLAPANTAPGPVSAHVLMFSNVPDPNPDNNNRMTNFTLNASTTEADLAVTVVPQDVPATPEAQTTVNIAVKNNGTSSVSDVYVAVDSSSSAPVALTGVAANWICTPTAQASTLCRTTSTIAAGATSTFAIRFRTPPQASTVVIYARVQAEPNRDIVATNDFTFGLVQVGSSTTWRRILLPTTATNIPGAGGSLWKSDITMLIKSPTPLDIRPSPCDTIIVVCPIVPPPLNRPFNGEDFVIDKSAPGGQFLYVPAADDEKLRFNMRVYDQSRAEQTAGAEIPIVREDEFTTGSISLIGIPVAPQYRHTLRVYEADARLNPRVLIRVYAGSDLTPRISTVRTLERSPNLARVTDADLPTHPSYLQTDLSQLLSLTGLESVRVELEPVDSGLRLWGFISIVNNETHHVTTVTPQ